MAGFVDSVADVRAGVVKCGLEAKYDIFVERKWDTYAKFAFASSFQPGSPDETPFLKQVVKAITGDEKTDSEWVSPLRRLYFEAHTYCTADLRAKVERTDEDKPLGSHSLCFLSVVPERAVIDEEV